MNSFHIPSMTLLGSYFIPIFTFGITYSISMLTPRFIFSASETAIISNESIFRLHEPFDGKVMWVYGGDYHLSTSISHGLARRLGTLGLSIGAVVFLFVVLHKAAYMQLLLKKEFPTDHLERCNWLINMLRVTGISSSVFMIFVCAFPESEGLTLHLTFALLYFGSNIAYQQVHLAVDEIFELSLTEPKLHRFRKWCSFFAIFCLFGVGISLAAFDNMIVSSGLEILMAIFMFGFYSSLHFQYSNIHVDSHLIAVIHQVEGQ